MPCDICGREVRAVLTEIEGAKLFVCKDCNPTGKGVIKREFKKRTTGYNGPNKFNGPRKIDLSRSTFKKKAPMKTFSSHRYNSKVVEDFNLVDNYGLVLRKAREEKKLSLEDLAKKLRESESFIHKIENGKLKPNDRVLLKIYDFLGVSLVRPLEDEDTKDLPTPQKKDDKPKSDSLFTEVTMNNKKKLVY